MKATDIERAVLNQLRILPLEKQQEVLDFVEFIGHKLGNKTPYSSSSVKLKQEHPCLSEIAKLPIAERHKILASLIPATANDFLNDPDLTEFSVLDGEDWESEYD
ncbi:MAG: hypothetical protein RIM23_23190 [Coleofasciculus sp. G3-WIS-01]|uniref:hypothetical protein n=1 Tax=Coleofasciculus sp. G3-WIS-01 TaxID=3069528 RepID=UPI0032F10FFC